MRDPRFPVLAGQLRRKPNGVVVRVVATEGYETEIDGSPDMGGYYRWDIPVRNVETNRLSYPHRSTVEKWAVVEEEG